VREKEREKGTYYMCIREREKERRAKKRNDFSL
jgi:hypothetical protein